MMEKSSNKKVQIIENRQEWYFFGQMLDNNRIFLSTFVVDS